MSPTRIPDDGQPWNLAQQIAAAKRRSFPNLGAGDEMAEAPIGAVVKFAELPRWCSPFDFDLEGRELDDRNPEFRSICGDRKRDADLGVLIGGEFDSPGRRGPSAEVDSNHSRSGLELVQHEAALGIGDGLQIDSKHGDPCSDDRVAVPGVEDQTPERRGSGPNRWILRPDTRSKRDGEEECQGCPPYDGPRFWPGSCS